MSNTHQEIMRMPMDNFMTSLRNRSSISFIIDNAAGLSNTSARSAQFSLEGKEASPSSSSRSARASRWENAAGQSTKSPPRLPRQPSTGDLENSDSSLAFCPECSPDSPLLSDGKKIDKSPSLPRRSEHQQ